MKSLSPEHKKAISLKTGLGGLTHMQPVYLRRVMLVRLAKRYSSDKHSIHIGGTDIPITQTDVNQIMGLPIEGNDITLRMRKPVDNNMLIAYGTDGKLKLNKLEELIKASTTPDDHFIRLIVLYAIGTVIAPTSKDYVKTNYLSLVENVADLPNLNWGCFTLNHLFSSIQKFNQTGESSLHGNLPFLQVSARTLV
jgi:hypothetical protein